MAKSAKLVHREHVLRYQEEIAAKVKQRVEAGIAQWRDRAHLLLLPFRNRDVVKSMTLTGPEADKLVATIAEALNEAYSDGGYDEAMRQGH